MIKLSLLAVAAVLAAPSIARPFTPQDMVGLSRVGAPVVSPDGRWVVWDQRETDLAANKGRHDLWRLDLKARGAAPQKFASTEAEESDPYFGPDGALYFLSNRERDTMAVWRVTMAAEAATRVTGNHDLSGFKLS